LAVALVVAWRLVRFTARLLLLGAVIALIAGYATHRTSTQTPHIRTQPPAARAARRPPATHRRPHAARHPRERPDPGA
jgi:hypothetical protein